MARINAHERLRISQPLNPSRQLVLQLLRQAELQPHPRRPQVLVRDGQTARDLAKLRLSDLPLDAAPASMRAEVHLIPRPIRCNRQGPLPISTYADPFAINRP